MAIEPTTKAARDLVRQLNREHGSRTFRTKKCRLGWPNHNGATMIEGFDGYEWTFVAYADESERHIQHAIEETLRWLHGEEESP